MKTNNPSRHLQLSTADLEETFTRSSGPGGQHVNKVSTAVTLKHLPSGIFVTAQDSRSQATNRRLARERLLAALEAREQAARQASRAALAQTRRRNAPRPRALKQKILEDKRRRAQVKKLRAKPID